MSPKETLHSPDGGKCHQSVLEHMYETGEWSDLTVRSSDNTLFKVHKSVVCAASTFFREACISAPGFRETHATIVDLAECDCIVMAILKHFYSLSATFTTPDLYQWDEAVTIDNGQHLIRLRIAIDKYGIDSMAATIEKTLSTFLFRAAELRKADIVVRIGCRLFDEPCDLFKPSRFDALQATAKLVPRILCNDKTFEMWHGNAKYMQSTLKVREVMRLGELE
ncbi:hypothetical protein CB0940_10111 [Cercospora beticola]|uniref:BTB domain-containing protein n=1 Tax=Cercospora beticola TaxID=122368 RepID=A0A2G5HV39_CERBT|nr:hypothetical protein CB0940_10111 [Cercospora beticola]PIA96102.1 hypothetical protein CB0940_10111 [Cercospora beticola]WPB06814.1 hypothetical protein RHO25_011474 [Cercospora beticola]CAK1366727.1 unnamed protein product [Cercospora beticola]